MNEPIVIGLLLFGLGLLQVIAIGVLGVIWSELRRLRDRLHDLENEVASIVSLEEAKRQLREARGQ